ncbi:hypothetical protein JB92DRAFT_3141941 [Gautieria morchelliformis]|nr:hypothetical protein JB92DRAFT_3141941 [Gautieria morchelliformis]
MSLRLPLLLSSPAQHGTYTIAPPFSSLYPTEPGVVKSIPTRLITGSRIRRNAPGIQFDVSHHNCDVILNIADANPPSRSLRRPPVLIQFRPPPQPLATHGCAL